ncbi:MAG: GspH/FimT family pseudopilin [Proteobacteria bacterium]|nr:GspH/FimT family pseudopilin [Pseudomonadota bacterium]
MKPARTDGFTLLELLVVLAIVALMTAIAAPRFAAALPGAELDSGARKLAAGLREARSMAVSTNRAVPFTLRGGANLYTIGRGGESRQLPGKLAITLVTGSREIIGANQGSIRFFPDGSSTGGRIELKGAGGKRSIEVDWLTGRIRLGE